MSCYGNLQDWIASLYAPIRMQDKVRSAL